MHTIFSQADGWNDEVLRDDSQPGSEPGNLADNLPGCTFIVKVRKNQDYTATIRYEEHQHNRYVSVEAVVYRRNGSGEMKTLEDAVFLEEKDFTGEQSKANAASYALQLKQQITQQYFGESYSERHK